MPRRRKTEVTEHQAEDSAAAIAEPIAPVAKKGRPKPPNPGVELLKQFVVRAAATIVCTLAIQTGALLWWAGSLDARVSAVERAVVQIDQRVHTLETKPR
ncbi:MAG: hypothetical protein ACOY3Y_01660 [Acidobacteriota bacterium]